MKRIIWFLLLAATATGLALLMGDSRASVALFWPPYRISLSLNLLILLLLAFFVLLYFALRALQAFWSMPERAQNWRKEYHERIQLILRVIGKDEVSLFSYIDNVLAHHFDTFQEDIKKLYEQNNNLF